MFRGVIAEESQSPHLEILIGKQRGRQGKGETYEHHRNIFGPFAHGFQVEYGYEAHARVLAAADLF